METIWFVIVTAMLAVYVLLDGFDFGVGMLYPFVARTERERGLALASIGPVWNGNEVWLVAGGGLLFFAFPRAYAAGFSGFYLALVLVLWLLIFRGLALELRGRLDHVLWRQFWDWAFCGASLLLAVVFGTALGNLVRGVPLNAEGYFFTPFWTTGTPGPSPGIVDWYTVLMGLTSAAILALHGANYLAVKTDGDLYGRATRLSQSAGWAAAGLIVMAVLAIPSVQPNLRLNYDAHPIGYLFPAVGLLALAASPALRRRNRDAASFVASSLLILALLGSLVWGLYPNLLVATTDPAHSLTVFNAAAARDGLRTGLTWFLVGFCLVIAYTLVMHRTFWGKVDADRLGDH